MSATIPARPPATDDAALSLRGVLESSLPRELGTAAAPDRYTVEAVFSRRVSPQERTLIEQPSVSQHLADKGFPGITLEIADRRLVIRGTSLPMLENGLAHEIAAMLHGIEETIAAERARRAAEVDAWQVAEVQRAAAVKDEAGRVHFD
jgi:hypothetical protein